MWRDKWTSEGDDFSPRKLIYKKYNDKYLLLV